MCRMLPRVPFFSHSIQNTKVCCVTVVGSGGGGGQRVAERTATRAPRGRQRDADATYCISVSIRVCPRTTGDAPPMDPQAHQHSAELSHTHTSPYPETSSLCTLPRAMRVKSSQMASDHVKEADPILWVWEKAHKFEHSAPS